MQCDGLPEVSKACKKPVNSRILAFVAFPRRSGDFTRVAAQACSTWVSRRLERLLPRRRGLAGPSFAEESAEDRHEMLGLLDVG